MILALLANPAWACAVCGAGQNDQSAYLPMTIVMSLLPLVLMGGVAFWVYRALKAADAREAVPSDDSYSVPAAVSGTATRYKAPPPT